MEEQHASCMENSFCLVFFGEAAGCWGEKMRKLRGVEERENEEELLFGCFWGGGRIRVRK